MVNSTTFEAIHLHITGTDGDVLTSPFGWLCTRGFVTGLLGGLLLIYLLWPQSEADRYQVFLVEKPWLRRWLYWEPAPQWQLDYYVTKGYNQISKALGRPFKVTVCGLDTVVLPAKYLPQLRASEREVMSLCESFENMFNLSITCGPEGRHDHVEIDVVSRYLNPRLSQLFQPMLDFIDGSFQTFLGDAHDWKPVGTFEFATYVVFRTTSRTLVGDELARNDAYIQSIIDFSTALLFAGFVWPIRPCGPLRNFFYWAGTVRLRMAIQRSFKFILPLVEARMADYPVPADQEPPIDIVQGLLEMEVTPAEEATALRHGHRTLHLSFASASVSSALVLYAIHQMLLTPEHQPALREEIAAALATHGGWTEKAVTGMPFLDSYLRELLRMNPPSVLAGQRTLHRDYIFDDDLRLPALTRIAFPVANIAYDADNYPKPDTFDPYRFMTMPVVPEGGPQRAAPECATKPGEKFLAWGYGKQACPGRFLAIRQVKMVLAKLLNEYEFKWAGPAPKRLKKQVVEGQVFPDITTKISIRKRNTG